MLHDETFLERPPATSGGRGSRRAALGSRDGLGLAGASPSQFLRHRALYLLLLPTFLLLSIFSLVPFVLAFATSLCEYEVGESPKFVGLANYREYFSDQTLLISFSNMLFLTTFAVIVTIIVPLTIAKLIFSLSSERASYFYRVLFLIPIVVPGVAVILIWKSMIYGDTGFVNSLLKSIGHENWTHGW